MAAKEQNFEWWQGDPGTVTFDLAAVAGTVVGAAGVHRIQALAGGVSVADITAIAFADSPKEAVVTYAAGDTSGLAAGNYLHQLLVTPSGGVEFVAAQGILKLFEKTAAAP